MLKKLNPDLVLRVAAGLFFLIPGIFKVLSPGDFEEFLSFFPTHFDEVSHLLFWMVTVLQIVGGLALLVGKHFRALVVPLAVVSIVALLTTVPNDTGSAQQYLAVLTHIMTFGIFMGLFMIGPKKGDLLDRLIAPDASRGWDLVRISLSFFWIGLGAAIWFAPQLLSGVPALLPVDFGFWGYALVGLVSLKIGFFLLTQFFTAHAAKASLLGFALLLILVAVPDMTASKIGLINALFMVLGVGASLALDMKECSCWKKMLG